LQRYIDKEDHRSTLKLVDKLAARWPENAEIAAERAIVLFNLKRTDEAFDYLSGLMQRFPGHVAPWRVRAILYRNLRLHDRAVADLTEALTLTKDTSMMCGLLNLRADSKEDYRDIQGSINDYRSAIRLDSTDYLSTNNLAMVLGHEGQFVEAEQLMMKVVRYDTTMKEAPFNLGFLYVLMKRDSMALEVLDKALASQPDFAYGYNNRGMVKHRLGRTEEAIKDIEHSLRLKPYNSYAYRNLVQIYSETNKPQKACEMCRMGLKLGFTADYGEELNKFYSEKCTE
jgi:tetratricopeptide (TPR) repeat protein